MFCNFCGEKTEENISECPNCGIEINETGTTKENMYVCRVCGAENPLGERKCNYCCSLL